MGLLPLRQKAQGWGYSSVIVYSIVHWQTYSIRVREAIYELGIVTKPVIPALSGKLRQKDKALAIKLTWGYLVRQHVKKQSGGLVSMKAQKVKNLLPSLMTYDCSKTVPTVELTPTNCPVNECTTTLHKHT